MHTGVAYGGAAMPRALRLAQASYPLSHRPLTTVPTARAVAVPAAMPLEVALVVLTRARVRHLAVLDDDGRCVGVASDRMITAMWVGDPLTFPDRHVGDVTDRVTVSGHATVGIAATLMKERGCDAVAVVGENGVPVGLVTSADLVALISGVR